MGRGGGRPRRVDLLRRQPVPGGGGSDRALPRFDSIGSPNYVFFIYDGDDSDVRRRARAGRFGADREDLRGVLRGQGEPYKGTDFTGRSDYGPFIAVGVPLGGLFTGAEGIKTAEEATIWGGTAGQQYDPATTRRATPLRTTATKPWT